MRLLSTQDAINEAVYIESRALSRKIKIVSSLGMVRNVPTFVDLQGFIVNGKFTVKEAAILRRGAILSHYIFEEPAPWQSLTEQDKKGARWLARNHHRLRWTDGFVPYGRARKLIRTAVRGPVEEKEEEERRPLSQRTDAGRSDQGDCDDYNAGLIYAKGLEKSEWLRDILGEDYADRVKSIDAHYSDIARFVNLSAAPELRCGRCHPQCAMENVFKIRDFWLSRNTTNV